MAVDDSTTAAPRSERWSVRAQVRVALLCAILLVFPQVGLTLYYLDQIRDVAAQSSERAIFVVSIDALRRDAESLNLPILPSRIKSETRGDLAHLIDRLAKRTAKLPTGSQFSAADALELLGIIAHADNRSTEWLDLATLSAGSFLSADALDELSLQLGNELLDLHTPREEFSAARAELLDRLETHAVNALAALKQEEQFAESVVDHADRNLFTLTMLTFLLLAVIFVVLPERLVRPIRRLTHLVRGGARGGSEPSNRHAVRDAIGGNDELTLLAATFDETLQTLAVFDERKRERITMDGARIDGLLESLDHPTVVLTPDLLLDTPNKAFRKLFGVTGDDIDRPIASLFSSGGDALRQQLVRTMARSEVCDGVVIDLSTRLEDTRSYELWISRCIDRRGHPASLILRLKPVTNAG
ncbi:MAG: PAS domain-containing protein [Myxococcota bacterium]